MYSRRVYVSLLALAVASLQFSAAFGPDWQPPLAYALAAGFGVVIFYHGERRVTAGPVFVNAGAAILVGTALCLLLASSLTTYILATPWDIALWQAGLLLWDSTVGIAVVFVSSFFVVAFGASIH